MAKMGQKSTFNRDLLFGFGHIWGPHRCLSKNGLLRGFKGEGVPKVVILDLLGVPKGVQNGVLSSIPVYSSIRYTAVYQYTAVYSHMGPPARGPKRGSKMDPLFDPLFQQGPNSP